MANFVVLEEHTNYNYYHDDEIVFLHVCVCTHTPLYRSPTPELLSEDMRRDRERRQWEEEAEEELEQDQPVGPVHYQKLREEEVRTHGAGYYAFSVDEEQRKEQIGLLNKLREQVS